MPLALAALLTGIAVGIIFRLLRLPIPAPAVLEGVLGVVGLWAGYEVGSLLLDHWPSIRALFLAIFRLH